MLRPLLFLKLTSCYWYRSQKPYTLLPLPLLPRRLEELCKDPEAATWMLDQLKVQAKADKLKGFEVVKKLLLDPEPFSVENELLTPTFKYKRPQLQKKYQAEIDAMYKALNE